MQENSTFVKRISIIIFIIALLINPFAIGYCFCEDYYINNKSIVGGIIFIEIILAGIGIYLFVYTPLWIINKKKELLLLFMTFCLSLFFFEILLHMYPLLLGQNFVNAVLTKYNTQQEGIYYHDPVLHIDFMKPNFTTINYYNGYYWIHKTDSKGFRNEKERETADIVLLGDSLIYGHGVNFNQTVGFFIENLTEYSVVNLARQGDTSYQELYILNTNGLLYSPQYVFYFFYENDITDLLLHTIDLQQFIETPQEQLTFLTQKPQPWQNFTSFFDWRNVYTLRAMNMILQQITTPTRYELENDTLAWEYTEKAILIMNQITTEQNVTFVIVPITPTRQEYFNKLKMIAIENDIEFINATNIIKTNTLLFLPYDGHFSEEGAKATATLIAEYITKKSQ